MDKKIPALVVLAAFTTEAVLSEHHHDATHPQPHTETGVKPPPDAALPTMGGEPRARSLTVTIAPNEGQHATPPHIEPTGGAGHVRDFVLNQIS